MRSANYQQKKNRQQSNHKHIMWVSFMPGALTYIHCHHYGEYYHGEI